MTITVIIPTYNRPDCIKENLYRLKQQQFMAEQIIVVDASVNDDTRRIVDDFPGVVYLKNSAGRGNTPHSRNLAIEHATGEILAFLDDDAFPHPGWTDNLRMSYADPTVAGVAGRALNGLQGEAQQGLNQIGCFLPSGRLTGNFAADPGKIVEVDHMIGCNMSLRSSVVGCLGGFRDDMLPGPFGICEETDICVRARRLGYRLIFNPAVCVDHIGARQPGGRRFGPKYGYYHTKNNFVMIVRNYGIATMAGRYAVDIASQAVRDFTRKTGGAIGHLAGSFAGLAVGLVTGLYWLARTGLNPVRRDVKGQRIRDYLQPKSDRS